MNTTGASSYSRRRNSDPDYLSLSESEIRDFLDFSQPTAPILPSIPESEETYTDKKSTGRKQIVDTKILGKFQSLSKPSPPKKEYLRCKMIRGHKRANRQIEKKIFPKRTLNVYSAKAQSYWDQLTKCFNLHKSVLVEESKTEAGPKTDGKTKRNTGENNIPKSFNEKFCKRYFQPVQVRESYFYYTEYIFSEFEPDVLCKKFKLRCCRAPEHSSECLNAWNLLKFYVQKIMLDNLDVEPWMSIESTNDLSQSQRHSKSMTETKIDEIIDMCYPEEEKEEERFNLFREIDEDIDPEVFFGLEF